MLAQTLAYSLPENTLVLMHCEDSNSPTSVGPMRPPRLATLFMIATPVAAAGPAAIIGQASVVPAHIMHQCKAWSRDLALKRHL